MLHTDDSALTLAGPHMAQAASIVFNAGVPLTMVPLEVRFLEGHARSIYRHSDKRGTV